MELSALSPYFDWLDAKLRTIEYGVITLSFTVCDSSVTKVDRVVSESEKISLQKKMN